MSVLTQLAHFQGRRDEAPNRALGHRLVRRRDRRGVREIVQGLEHPDPRVQANCVQVLEAVGTLEPAYLIPHLEALLHLLKSRNNRLVWGGMQVLRTVAPLAGKTLYARRALLQQTIRTGSVITRDQGTKVLAVVASQRPEYRRALLPFFVDHLRSCRSQDVPQHSESIAEGWGGRLPQGVVAVLEDRLPDLRPSRAVRVRRLLRKSGEAPVRGRLGAR